MTDIRERVEKDRGLLKKIQLAIPGFRGYRKREDLRAADSILRIQIADKLVGVRRVLEDARETMAENADLQNIDKLGGLINKLSTVEGKVRHAEQGYSGISWAIRIKEEELDRLYEYDYGMIQQVQALESSARDVLTSAENEDSSGTAQAVRKMMSSLKEFERIFSERIEVITGIKAL